MFNNLIGIYLAEKYSITTDRILFAVSVDANDTSTFTIANATNGSKLKADLSSFNYFLTKYTIWSQNGILDITLKPDDEQNNQLKTWAFTKRTEAPIVPPKLVEAELQLIVTNDQNVDDDLFLAIELFRIPQDNVPDLVNLAKSLCLSPDNIDIQTLAIEKYIIYTNELLKALILANGGSIPGDIGKYVQNPPNEPRYYEQPKSVCRRT